MQRKTTGNLCCNLATQFFINIYTKILVKNTESYTHSITQNRLLFSIIVEGWDA